MGWRPTNELRWLTREIKTDPFYIHLDSMGQRVAPTARFLQQKWEHVYQDDHGMFAREEWRDVPETVEE